MTEQTPSHAELFAQVARQFMQAAVEFAKGTAGTFTAVDVAKLYLSAGGWLAAREIGRDGAMALLRDLADAIARDDGPKTFN